MKVETQRLLLACDMYEVGIAMVRARLRREHPDASDAQLDLMVGQWLHARPLDGHGVLYRLSPDATADNWRESATIEQP